MNNGADAAEQIVKLSLEGVEVAAKLSGSAAKNVAVLLVAVLKQEQKTKGKVRLTNMLKSGKKLKVFSLQNKDLKKFAEQAKRYGVLYCVLRDKNTTDENTPVDIIARAEDASKIQRIVERFELGTVTDKASIISEVEKVIAERDRNQKARPTKSKGEQIMEEAIRSVPQEKGGMGKNPTMAKAEENFPSRPDSEQAGTPFDKRRNVPEKKPSVRKKLERYKEDARRRRERERSNLKNQREMWKSRRKSTRSVAPVRKRNGKAKAR